MKFSEQWLRQWLSIKADVNELAHQLTMAGLEVDSVKLAAPEFSGVVVGEILEIRPHPDAKRLNCCLVNVGKKEPLKIVCGGVNVREKLRVPVAIVGAVLPGDFKIKQAKLRGEESCGMICSGSELGLDEYQTIDHGIMELADDAPIGEDFREYFNLNDHVIDIELTPNRGDCLSIRGIAREVGVLNKSNVNSPKLKDIKSTIKDTFPIDVDADDKCPRYVGRVMRGINTNATTPIWLQEALRRSGIRCIHPVVDVMNYVMIELGQPMHAFDLATLNNKITVRLSKAGEKVKLLDEQTVTLKEDTLVIADDKQVQAIAGVMGGFDSSVTAKTTDIFLESAFFIPHVVRIGARTYSLQTDSSYRFERGVDYQLQVQAIERATQLLLDIVGGQAGPVTMKEHKKSLPVLSNITLRKPRIAQVLGMTFADKDVETMLTALGMSLKAKKEAWTVSMPSFRFDITQEIDLIEEIARVYGYDNIPTQMMIGELTMPNDHESEVSSLRIAQLLADLGYVEAMTYSFVDRQWLQRFDPIADPITLVNPISSDMSVMRTSIWPGLVSALQYNMNRQAGRVRLFERGLCFHQQGDEWVQEAKLAMLLSGQAQPEQWGIKERGSDFYDLKGAVEQLLALTGRSDAYRWEKGSHPALHLGQTAVLMMDGEAVGFLGALHPSIAQDVDKQCSAYLFEVDLTAIQSGKLPQCAPISKFPSVRRDLALLLDQGVTSAELLEQVAIKAGELLSKAQIFDVYQGKGIENGKKSVALGLTFQHPSRTLRDTEINDVIQGVVEDLQSKFNATLRT